MNSFLIFGAYGEKGFEYCSHFLEEGYKVIHCNYFDDSLEPNIIEEKRLQVGRNSNFSEINMDDSFALDDTDTLSILVPEEVIECRETGEVLESLTKLMNNLQNLKKIFLFLPNQWLHKKESLEDVMWNETRANIEMYEIGQYQEADKLTDLIASNKQEVV